MRMNIQIVSEGVGHLTEVLVDGKAMEGITKIEWKVEVGCLAETIITCRAGVDLQGEYVLVLNEESRWKQWLSKFIQRADDLIKWFVSVLKE